jgi:hypothetical protein
MNDAVIAPLGSRGCYHPPPRQRAALPDDRLQQMTR